MSIDREAALTALEAFGSARERQGLERGFAVAERIVSWLTRQPDTRRQAEVRGWARGGHPKGL